MTHVFVGSALALVVLAPDAAPSAQERPRFALTREFRGEIVCAIDDSSWTSRGGRPRASEVCVYRDARLGGRPVTHSITTLEWDCSEGRTEARNRRWFLAGRSAPLGRQEEARAVQNSDWAALRGCHDLPSTTGLSRESVDSFVSARLAAWNAPPPAAAAAGEDVAGPSWIPIVRNNAWADCAVAVEDLLQTPGTAQGRIACVYRPQSDPPHRLGAGPRGRPLTFRWETAWFQARCQDGAIAFAQGDLYRDLADRRPYRAWTDYLGPVTLYSDAAGREAIVRRVCDDRTMSDARPGSLQAFAATTLAAWASSR